MIIATKEFGQAGNHLKKPKECNNRIFSNFLMLYLRKKRPTKTVCQNSTTKRRKSFLNLQKHNVTFCTSQQILKSQFENMQ